MRTYLEGELNPPWAVLDRELLAQSSGWRIIGESGDRAWPGAELARAPGQGTQPSGH